MCAAGFDLMDTLVCAERSMSEPPPHSCGPTVVRPARPDDAPVIEAIAHESFSGYVAGHYHADPRLDRVKCDDVYVSWSLRACRGEAADATFVGEVDGRIAGFLSVTGGERARRRSGRDCWRPASRGVPDAHRGNRPLVHGRRLEADAHFHADHESGVPEYLAPHGFRTCGGTYTFHKWFDDAAVAAADARQRLNGARRAARARYGELEVDRRPDGIAAPAAAHGRPPSKEREGDPGAEQHASETDRRA